MLILPEVQAGIPFQGTDTINIGLLISDNKAIEAVQGAEIALNNANKRLETKEKNYFKLIVLSMEGPWGTGSKQAVSLIYQHNVWAILGSHGGRNAHLVEQVTAKEHNIFLSAWSTDPTLSKAFVPWYFSCVYNDSQQAESLVDEIYVAKNISTAAVISDDGYDSKSAADNFVKAVILKGKEEPLKFVQNNDSENLGNIVDMIAAAHPGCIVLFTQPDVSLKIITRLHARRIDVPVYGTLSLLQNDITADQLTELNKTIITASADWLRNDEYPFTREYNKKYGKLPGAVAAYAYDGLSIIIRAIMDSNYNRDNLQKSMANIKYKGITGDVRFDDRGNRSGEAPLIMIKNGIPVTEEK